MDGQRLPAQGGSARIPEGQDQQNEGQQPCALPDGFMSLSSPLLLVTAGRWGSQETTTEPTPALILKVLDAEARIFLYENFLSDGEGCLHR